MSRRFAIPDLKTNYSSGPQLQVTTQIHFAGVLSRVKKDSWKNHLSLLRLSTRATCSANGRFRDATQKQ